MAKVNVRAEVKFNRLRVYLNGAMHISIKFDDIVGVQSFIIDNYCHIEYYTKETVIESTYLRKDTWLRILKALEKINII